MEIKQIFEEVLEEDNTAEIKRLEKELESWKDEKFDAKDPKDIQDAEEEIKKIKQKIKYLKGGLDESQLSEMAADEKKNRLDVLNAKLNEITVEIRTSDDKDPARKQTLNQRRTEIQKQINTLRMVEVTK